MLLHFCLSISIISKIAVGRCASVAGRSPVSFATAKVMLFLKLPKLPKYFFRPSSCQSLAHLAWFATAKIEQKSPFLQISAKISSIPSLLRACTLYISTHLSTERNSPMGITSPPPSRKKKLHPPLNSFHKTHQKTTYRRSPIKPTVGRSTDLPWVARATYSRFYLTPPRSLSLWDQTRRFFRDQEKEGDGRWTSN